VTLRLRLNLLITALSAVVFIASGLYVISNARTAVREETQSSARLALQLVELAISGAAAGHRDVREAIVDQFTHLDTTRHLQISVLSHGQESAGATGMVPPVGAEAPAWFVRLVEPAPMQFRRVVAGPAIPYTEILIRADPSDEITEAWRETSGLLGFLLLFLVLVNVLVYLMLGRDLAPIESILRGLERVEQGDYRLRLPRFPSTELSRISEKFNHMAEVLLRSREENRFLTQRSLEIQEQERRHLARELHDELGQSLSAIKAVAASVSVGEVDTATRAQAMRTIAEITDRTYGAVRAMMRRLRPPVLDELGLLPALQELVDNWNTGQGDCFCRLEVAGNLPPLSDELEISLYRIVQEGLTNVARHAQAGDVLVRLERAGEGGGISLTVRDDGVGFDPGVTRRGLGLLGMRERVEALGGEMRTEAAPGAGVTLHITLPENATA
jgi:two-component system sensor histidine kinase UhpB